MNNTTINGLRLVTPEEAGKSGKGKSGVGIKAVIMLDDHARWAIGNNDAIYFSAELIDLPKPRTTRPYRRGEVRCGDVFRNKQTGNDYLITGLYRNDQVWMLSEVRTYQDLFEHFDRLTYDSEGREVLEVAGVTE